MGGSVSAPAPDPALVDAQLESLNTQSELGRRQLAAANELAPTQREQMKFGLDASKTAYDQVQADRQYALGKRDQYDQAVQATMDESGKFDEAVRRQELMQQAQADISEQFSAAQAQQQRGLQRAGVMPGSGKALLAGQQAELAEAAAKSRAGLMVTEAAKKEGLQLQGQNVAMLQGYPAQAASLAPSGANLGVMGLDTTNSALTGMGQTLGAADKAAAAYGGMAGDMWSNANKLYTGAQEANQKERSEEVGSAVGLAAGLGYKGYNNSQYSPTKSIWDTSRSGVTTTR